MQAVLVMFRSDGERRSFSVTRDMTVIGRREDCDLRIPLGDISRKHARLVRDGDTLRLEDLGSSNGTFLNAQRVQEAVLSPGDTVQIGPVVFVLQIDNYPMDDELHPVIAEAGSHVSPEPEAADTSPLSPTAQSEVEDYGHLDPLPPLEEDAGLEPLPSLEEHGELEALPPLGEEGGLEELPSLEAEAPMELEALPLDEPVHEIAEPAPVAKAPIAPPPVAPAPIAHAAAAPAPAAPAPVAHAAVHAAPVAPKVAAKPKGAALTMLPPPPIRSAPKLVARPPIEMEPLPFGESSHDDLGEMELLPDTDEGHTPYIPPSAPARPGSAHPHDELDMDTLPELAEEESLELLPDDPAHVGHDDAIDLDFGVDSQPHPHA